MNKNFSILDQIGLVQADHERQPPPEIIIENNPMPRPGVLRSLMSKFKNNYIIKNNFLFIIFKFE